MTPIPRFVIVREGEHWAVGRHVATCNEVPVYSLVDETFEEIQDATAWVAARLADAGVSAAHPLK